MLRGNHPARVDDKGRLKIPTGFRELIEKNYGSDIFVTSLSGDNVLIYPMDAWIAFEQKFKGMPSFHPTRKKFMKRVHFFGQATTLDRQGRMVVPTQLRESAQMKGPVDVLGIEDHLEVWNHDHLAKLIEGEPFGDDDLRAMAEFGI